jgi:hypothetical protein
VTALTGGARAGSPATHGWYAFAAHRALSLDPALWRDGANVRVPIDAVRIWWATLDSNQ